MSSARMTVSKQAFFYLFLIILYLSEAQSGVCAQKTPKISTKHDEMYPTFGYALTFDILIFHIQN